MSSELAVALAALAERLIQLSAEDTVFRGKLRQVAQAFLAATENGLPGENEVRSEVAAISAAVAADRAGDVTVSSPAVEAVREVLPPLTLGSRTVLSEEPPKPTWPAAAVPASEADLPMVEARCRLKAEGCRWAATRQRRLQQGASYRNEVEPQDREIIEKARGTPGCYLWMNNRNAPIPKDLGLWDDAAGCFEAVANGVALVRGLLAEPRLAPGLFEKALDLLAEAQSALRVAVEAIDGRADPDQSQIFTWLKQMTAQEQVFIQRYMRADDPADPDSWSDISARIEALDAQLRSKQQRRKTQESRLRKVHYHLKPIQAGRGTDHDWRTIVNTVTEMIRDGLPPSNVELRELLAPVIEELPDWDDLPAEFRSFLYEYDRYLASRSTEPDARPAPTTAEVREAARLLQGRSVLVIGGSCRPAAKDALESAFGLKELVWFETREHESVSIFEPAIARADVAVVLLAIRWSSHSYGEVKQFCDKHGKAFVRLPGGYNPNQVAVQIMAQTRGRL